MKYFFLSFILFFTIACEDRHAFAEYQGVNEKAWKAQDTLIFAVDNLNTKSVYQITLAVRHNKTYEFSNAWFKLFGLTTKKDTLVEIPLFNNMGKPYGRCTGSLCTQHFPIKKVQQFKQKEVVFKVVHLMRQDPLFGIKDIGLIIDEK